MELSLSITGARSELGRIVARQHVAGRVHFNIAGQQANTLLHDGHAWKQFARSALAGARRASKVDPDFVVHASFAFVLGHPRKDPLRSIAETIIECENLVLSGSRPACVVRLQLGDNFGSVPALIDINPNAVPTPPCC